VCVCVCVCVNKCEHCESVNVIQVPIPLSCLCSYHSTCCVQSIIMVLLHFLIMNQVYFFPVRYLDWTQCFLGSLICLAMFLISTETVTVRDCWFHQCTFSQTCAHIKINRKEEKRREASVCVWISLYCILDKKIKHTRWGDAGFLYWQDVIIWGGGGGGVLYGNDWFLISVEFVLFL